ncbi:sigma-70 family RNA polymerase sigma factor [Sedimentisphaera salicampi]|uniref:RNA polymerase sigma factor, sigma-70 family n=1 Tax=Sedimentisphaera salicampi TaxID=1941349 RepID=A0A1W6LN03_9BACT|nr:sigma-70 family RNA polymerase sigma factor [Sedimentisphaera salicampi]ARN57157.1 RNA polymerase sigma factor, sigma-70 family [Sedimentisphaera salicampi]
MDGNQFDYRQALREEVEDMLTAARGLKRKDRKLIEQYFLEGQSITNLAKSRGKCRQTISKRISKLLKRLKDYNACYPRSTLGGAIARDYFLRGMSIRETAKARGCSEYRVRKHIKLAGKYSRKKAGAEL